MSDYTQVGPEQEIYVTGLIQVASLVNKGHGRRETRTLWASTELNDYLDWPGIQQVFRLERLVWHENTTDILGKSDTD